MNNHPINHLMQGFERPSVSALGRGVGLSTVVPQHANRSGEEFREEAVFISGGAGGFEVLIYYRGKHFSAMK